MKAKGMVRHLRGPILLHLDQVGLHLHGGLRLRDTIIVSGVPRGGTTWVMELLGTLRGYRTLFEPLHRGWFPKVRDLGLDVRPYLPVDQDYPEAEAWLGAVLTGKVCSLLPHYRLTLGNIVRRLSARKLVVKFVRASRMLPWIARRFHVRRIYVLVRHPCAVVESQLRTGVNGIEQGKPVSKEMVLRQALLMPRVGRDRTLMRRLARLETQEELLAATWALDHCVLIGEAPCPWDVIFYEALVEGGVNALQQALVDLGEPMPDRAVRLLGMPSIMAASRVPLARYRVRHDMWTSVMSRPEIERVIEIIRWFGLYLYDEGPQPVSSVRGVHAGVCGR